MDKIRVTYRKKYATNLLIARFKMLTTYGTWNVGSWV